jgi:hypothetical protein
MDSEGDHRAKSSGPFNFAISAWQNLLYLAGYDPAFPAGTVACGAGGESGVVVVTTARTALTRIRLLPPRIWRGPIG